MRNRFAVLLSASVLLGLGCRSAPQVEPDAPATAATPPTPAPSEAVLPHQTFTLPSRILGETRRINVYTPPGYDAAPEQRYLVLYMPDGGLAEDFPHVTNDVDAAIRAGQMRPMIVVGIENTQRRRDMTGPTRVASDKKIAPVVGGSAAFRAFIRDELMPEIARRVRGSGQTAIVGESLAGLFVLETFFEEPSLFDTYISLSPSIWWNDQALVHAAAARLKANPSIQARLYFATAGDDEQQKAAELLVGALRAEAPAGLHWSYQDWPKLKHATIYRGASPAVFRKLFPAR
jgi:predicted alpha/beta superfamily hydrolase